MPVRLSHHGPRPLAAVALAAASLLTAAAVGSIFLSTARDARAAIASAGPANPADGILVVVALVGLLLSLWVGLGMALTALSALPGAVGAASTRLAARIAPAAVRKIVAFVLGTTLTAALVPGTAVAGTELETTRQTTTSSAQYAVAAFGNVADAAPNASFRLVTEPTSSSGAIQQPQQDVAPSPSWLPEGRMVPGDLAEGVVVLRGDSLWSIAARHLGGAATTAEIDTEWQRWFAANHHVIGDDANLIAPGQVLRPPSSLQGDS